MICFLSSSFPTHPTTEKIADFLAGELKEKEIEEIEKHLEVCLYCRGLAVLSAIVLDQIESN